MSKFQKVEPKGKPSSHNQQEKWTLFQCSVVTFVSSPAISHYQHAVLPVDINLLPAVYVNQK